MVHVVPCVGYPVPPELTRHGHADASGGTLSTSPTRRPVSSVIDELTKDERYEFRLMHDRRERWLDALTPRIPNLVQGEEWLRDGTA